VATQRGIKVVGAVLHGSQSPQTLKKGAACNNQYDDEMVAIEAE
jgi:hypothetical protein